MVSATVDHRNGSDGRSQAVLAFLRIRGTAVRRVEEAFVEKLRALSTRSRGRDLSVLVEHQPDYDTVLETVVDAIDDAGLPIEDPT